MKDPPVDRPMPDPHLVASPICQLPKRAVTALEQATVDELLEPGAFTAMGHLPAAAVLADAMEYAERLVESVGYANLSDARRKGTLTGTGLMPADGSFLSQLFALMDVAQIHAVAPEKGAREGETLGRLVEDARDRLVERVIAWRQEPGRRSSRSRVQVGEGGVVWPIYVLPVGEEGQPEVIRDPDAFALFGALPLFAPYLMLEEDCFVAPRLE